MSAIARHTGRKLVDEPGEEIQFEWLELTENTVGQGCGEREGWARPPVTGVGRRIVAA